MKIIAFNASPNAKYGNTALILDPFLEGMKEKGAEIELFYLDLLDIKPCNACTDDASFASPGKCLCDDDMNNLYPKFREADVWIFATPNYYDTLPYSLKNLLDRLEPLFQPEFNELDNQISKNGTGKIAFVSTCDLFEMDNFVNLEDQIKSVSALFAKDYAGSLLRPQSQTLAALKDIGSHIDDIFEAARQAGRELVENGFISDETRKKVSRDLLPKDSFFEEVNNLINDKLSKKNN